MRPLLRLAIFGLLLAPAHPAWGEPFEVDGATLDLPMPEGFCARQVQPGDPRNADLERRQPPVSVLVTMAEPCAAPGPRLAYGRWLMLLDNGEPRRLAPRSSRREALRKSVENMPLLTAGTVFQIGFLSPNFTSGVIGRDDVANYRALVYAVSLPTGGSLTQAGIEGETILLGRSVAFQLFDTYRDDGTYAPLEAAVKAVMAKAAEQDPTGAAPRGEEARETPKPRYSPRLEVMETLWLIARTAGIAALVFALSAFVFRRRRGEENSGP